MSITLEDLNGLQHPNLKTLPSKVIYLMIQRRANEEGWAPITAREFSEAASLTIRGAYKILDNLLASGLIEKRQEKERHNAPNQYRTTN